MNVIFVNKIKKIACGLELQVNVKLSKLQVHSHVTCLQDNLEYKDHKLNFKVRPLKSTKKCRPSSVNATIINNGTFLFFFFFFFFIFFIYFFSSSSFFFFSSSSSLFSSFPSSFFSSSSSSSFSAPSSPAPTVPPPSYFPSS